MESSNGILDLSAVMLEKVFIIPDYQREYSWEKPQLQAFYEDLMGCAPNTKHLMGSLLTTIYSEVPKAHRKNLPVLDNGTLLGSDNKPYLLHEVIDGQQRLTTIIICLAAIRTSLKRHASQELVSDSLQDIEKYIRPRFFIDVSHEEIKSFFRVYPIIESKHQLDSIVSNNITNHQLSERKSNKLMIEAYDYFSTLFIDPRNALKFYKNLMRCASFWMHVLPSSAEANIIFDCQNNRGIPLTELDKVKNNLIYRVMKSEEAEDKKLSALQKINEAWSDIFRTLASRNIFDRSDEDRILKDAMIIVFGMDKADLHTLVFALEKQEKELIDISFVDIVSNFVSQLKSIASAYGKIRAPKQEDGNYVLYLNELQYPVDYFNNFRPILIALMTQQESLKIKTEKIDEIFKLARDAGFWVYGVAARRTNYGVPELGRMAHSFYKEKNYEALSYRLTQFTKEACLEISDNQKYHQVKKALIYVFERNNTKNQDFLAKLNYYFKPEVKEIYSKNLLIEICPKQSKKKTKQSVAEGLALLPTNFYPERYLQSVCKKRSQEIYNNCRQTGQENASDLYGIYYAELVKAAKEYFRYEKYVEVDLDDEDF